MFSITIDCKGNKKMRYSKSKFVFKNGSRDVTTSSVSSNMEIQS